MTRKFAFSLVILLSAVGLLPFSIAKDESLDQLIARADAAQPGQKPDLYIEVAERELRLTTDAYKDNKPEDGRLTLAKVVEFADKAHAAAIETGKKLPHTEIRIRRMSARLRDLKSNVDVDEQPIVQKAVDQLEDFRTDILKSLFAGKKS